MPHDRQVTNIDLGCRAAMMEKPLYALRSYPAVGIQSLNILNNLFQCSTNTSKSFDAECRKSKVNFKITKDFTAMRLSNNYFLLQPMLPSNAQNLMLCIMEKNTQKRLLWCRNRHNRPFNCHITAELLHRPAQPFTILEFSCRYK